MQHQDQPSAINWYKPTLVNPLEHLSELAVPTYWSVSSPATVRTEHSNHSLINPLGFMNELAVPTYWLVSSPATDRTEHSIEARTQDQAV